MHYRCFQAARLATVVLTFIVVHPPAHTEEQPQPMSEQARFFEAKIRPLLAQRCFDCHGPETQECGLRLDSLAAMLEGGESGPAIVRGSSKESLLVEAINYASLQMPPDEKLNNDQIAALTAWIETGALWPGARGDPQAKVRRSEKFTAEDRAWWARLQQVSAGNPGDGAQAAGRSPAPGATIGAPGSSSVGVEAGQAAGATRRGRKAEVAASARATGRVRFGEAETAADAAFRRQRRRAGSSAEPYPRRPPSA